MPSTLPSAFLQPTARPILIPAPRPGGLPRGMKVGPWQVTSAGHRLVPSTRYAVVHVETTQQAVLEVFDAPALATGSYTERMREVIAAVARLDHPGAPKLHDCGTLADGRPYLVREAIDGYTLDELRGDGPLPTRGVLGIVRAICDVVMAAHAAGVAHGMLDLDHVLARDADDPIVLLDWRIADVIDDEANRRAQLSTSARRHPLHVCSVAQDVFAIGVIMLQLIGDRVPHAVESLAQAMCADDPGARPSLEDVVAQLAAAEAALDRVAVAADDVALPPQLRVPTFLMSRAWRWSSLALACLAPIVFMAWRDPRPIAAADNREPIGLRVDPPIEVRLAPARVEHRAVASPSPSPAPAPAPSPVAAGKTAAMQPASARAARSVTRPRRASVKPAIETRAAVSPAVVRPPVVSPPAVKPAGVKPSADAALLRQYQRVGHDLIELEKQIGAMRVGELRADFRAIHLDEATANADARAAAESTLADLAERIARLRPIEVSTACLNNPLAADCQ